MKHVLFLCTGNSCRSIMAEGLLNHMGAGKFKAYSAGSKPSGFVHPASLATLKAHGMNAEGYRSKSWDELDGQTFDIVITVCDNAAGEVCPVFFSAPLKAHWGVPDPAHAQGSDGEKQAVFNAVFDQLRTRIRALVALPEHLDKAVLAQTLNDIGKL